VRGAVPTWAALLATCFFRAPNDRDKRVRQDAKGGGHRGCRARRGPTCWRRNIPPPFAPLSHFEVRPPSTSTDARGGLHYATRRALDT